MSDNKQFGISEQLDTISRAAVLDEIHKYMEERDYTIGTLYDNICEMPSAQPTDAEIQRMQDIEQAMLGKAYECGKQDAQRWIPVTERLPMAFETVNVTVQIPEGRYVKESALVNGAWQGASALAEVVAWVPLPEPWEGDKNE